MNSKYDKSVINGHNPMCKFVNYIKSQNELANLQGLPNYDVYGLTYDEVINYLTNKTEITIDAENLYAIKHDKTPSKRVWLFGLCHFLGVIICSLLAAITDNVTYIFFYLFLLFLPYLIIIWHKKSYIKWHNRQIYDEKIEKYLGVLSAYIDYLPIKIHHNWDLFINQETRCYNQLKESEDESLWHVIETRKFTTSEIECVKESSFSTTCGRRDVFVELINGEKCFIRCYGDFNLTDGEDVDLANTKVVVLSNKLGEKILKIKNGI